MSIRSTSAKLVDSIKIDLKKFFFGNERTKFNLIFGSMIFSLLLVPPMVFVVAGYVAKIFIDTLYGKNSMPGFESFQDLFVLGVGTLVGLNAYLFLATIIGLGISITFGITPFVIFPLFIFGVLYTISLTGIIYAYPESISESTLQLPIATTATSKKYFTGYLFALGFLFLIGMTILSATVIGTIIIRTFGIGFFPVVIPIYILSSAISFILFSSGARVLGIYVREAFIENGMRRSAISE